MIDRITLILKAKNITPAQLADDLKVQRSGISHILNGRNKPSLDFIQKILRKYPDISMPWLLFGEGPMMNQFTPEPIRKNESKTDLSLEQPTLIDLFEAEVNEDDDYPKETPVDNPENDNQRSDNQENRSIEDFISGISQKGKPGNSALSDRSISEDQRKIRRIIIFYDDKSFVEYTPGMD